MKKRLALVLLAPVLGCGSIPVANTGTQITQVTPEPVKTREEIAKDFAESLRESYEKSSRYVDKAREELYKTAETSEKQTKELYKGLRDLANQRFDALEAKINAIKGLQKRFEVYQKKGDK